jgi:hypothetical protein
MIIYVILDRGVIQPLVLPALGLSQSMDAIYTADVTLNPLEKIAFLWQIIQTSLGGFFHLFCAVIAPTNPAG